MPYCTILYDTLPYYIRLYHTILYSTRQLLYYYTTTLHDYTIHSPSAGHHIRLRRGRALLWPRPLVALARRRGRTTGARASGGSVRRGVCGRRPARIRHAGVVCLHHYTTALLYYYTATLLRTTLLQFYTATLLHDCTTTLLHCYTATRLHGHTATLLHCHSATLLHC
jgi:hypothetical protein